MRRPSRDTLIAYVVGAALVVPMILPVLDNIEEGKRLVEAGVLTARDRLNPTGLGPVSGLMVYVFATPIAITLAHSLGTKLVLIAGLMGVSLAISFITTMIERGNVALGLSLTWLTLAGLVSVSLWAWRRHGRSKEAVRQRADGLTRLVRDVVDRFRASAVGGSGLGYDGSGGRDVDLVEKMALGAIWQHAVEGRPDTFDRRVLKALTTLRDDMIGNTAVDPGGQGLAVMDRIVDSVSRHLRRSTPP